MEIVGFGFRLPVRFGFKLLVGLEFKLLVEFDFKLSAYKRTSSESPRNNTIEEEKRCRVTTRKV